MGACRLASARAARAQAVSLSKCSAGSRDSASSSCIAHGPFPPFPLDARELDPGVTLQTYLATVRGAEAVQRAAGLWAERQVEELPELSVTVERVKGLSPDCESFQYRLEWVPPSLVGITAFARAVGWEVDKRDILARRGEVARFSWKALAALIANAARTGVLRLPVAASEGTVEVQRVQGRVARVAETLSLARELRERRVQNKRVARDVLLLLTQRRPPGEDFVAWDERVWAELGLDEVPGMGPFDIDGLDDAHKDALLEDASLFIGFATLLVLGFGVSVASLYLHSVQQERALLEAMGALY